MSESSGAPQVIIIGAGIAGLTAAWRLHQRGIRTLTCEASEHLGGAIRSVAQDGWLIEVGPNTVMDRAGVLHELIAELGLEDQRVEADHTTSRRYIVRDGYMVPLPGSPADLWRSPAWSTRGKLRALVEPLIARGDAPERGVDESLASFARRRLGDELVEYGLDPFIAGTFAGKPQQLSARHTLGRLVDLEQEAGSIMLGALRRGLKARGRTEAEQQAQQRSRALINFKDGMQTLPRAMADRLGPERVWTRAQVTGAARGEDGRWRVHVTREGEAIELGCDAVIMATEAHAAARIAISDAQGPLDLSVLDTIVYPPVSVVYLGYARAQVRHPLDGFGVLIPEREGFDVLGAIFGSTVFANRTPEGHVMIAVFIGGARAPEHALLPEQDRVRMAIADMDRLLGLRGDPAFMHVAQWPEAIPQYEVGYGRILARIDALEQRARGLRFIGNYTRGISVPDTVAYAARTAREVGNILLHTW